ncbi:MAG: hypothetical protein CSA62_02775 [Planctomycetota bacterium]|nr:MAG: hypothetical protein CSA62_02775 [Planctomycetota bacterium]
MKHWNKLALGLLVAPYLPWLFDYWSMPSSYVMGSPIALGSAALAYQRERKSPEANNPANSGLGITLLCLALAAYLAATIIFARRSLAGVSLAAIAASLAYLYGGRPRLWRYRFSLSFLFCAAPVPGLIVDILNRHLIDFATIASSGLLGVLYSGVQHQGNMIILPQNGALAVVPDCSGLEGIVLFFVLGVLIVFLHPRLRLPWKLAMPAIAVALALAGNMLRIVITGMLQIHNPELGANNTLHQIVGISTLAAMMLLLFVLPRFMNKRGETAPGSDAPNPT